MVQIVAALLHAQKYSSRSIVISFFISFFKFLSRKKRGGMMIKYETVKKNTKLSGFFKNEPEKKEEAIKAKEDLILK